MAFVVSPNTFSLFPLQKPSCGAKGILFGRGVIEIPQTTVMLQSSESVLGAGEMMWALWTQPVRSVSIERRAKYLDIMQSNDIDMQDLQSRCDQILLFSCGGSSELTESVLKCNAF